MLFWKSLCWINHEHNVSQNNHDFNQAGPKIGWKINGSYGYHLLLNNQNVNKLKKKIIDWRLMETYTFIKNSQIRKIIVPKALSGRLKQLEKFVNPKTMCFCLILKYIDFSYADSRAWNCHKTPTVSKSRSSWLWFPHSFAFWSLEIFVHPNQAWLLIWMSWWRSAHPNQTWAGRRSSRFTGPSLFQSSPMVTISGSWPKERDPGFKRLKWVSFRGRLGSALEIGGGARASGGSSE